eukprot:gene10498-biopygen7660
MNDFRWSNELIVWKDLLLLLEGQAVHFPAPKSQYAQDIYLEQDTPVFATSKGAIEFVGKMASSSKSSPSTVKSMGVLWYNQFLKNFIRPYGAAEKLPDRETALWRLREENCEWLRRPHVAASEMAETMIENLKIVAKRQISEKKVKKLEEGMEKINSSLSKHGKDSKERASTEKTQKSMKSIVKPPGDVNEIMSLFAELDSGKIIDFIDPVNPAPKNKRKAVESVQDVLAHLAELDSDDEEEEGKKKKKKSGKKSKKAKKD